MNNLTSRFKNMLALGTSKILHSSTSAKNRRVKCIGQRLIDLKSLLNQLNDHQPIEIRASHLEHLEGTVHSHFENVLNVLAHILFD